MKLERSYKSLRQMLCQLNRKLELMGREHMLIIGKQKMLIDKIQLNRIASNIESNKIVNKFTKLPPIKYFD
jgi:hypothetical protein